MSDSTRFDWQRDADAIVLPATFATAIHLGPHGCVVIRQEDPIGEPDSVISVHKSQVPAVVAALLREAFDLESSGDAVTGEDPHATLRRAGWQSGLTFGPDDVAAVAGYITTLERALADVASRAAGAFRSGGEGVANA